ncbi:hypothetical protein MBIO_0487 [Mycoplasmopsis fermentans PG18]|uniref:Bacteriophage T5 Orf172 DNA-binding domain-containing protein n=2 Tax=Mycoplasmopsis fermentans TaxID=2115 RepID=C4XF30_MYCFP|nr:GIY-YIG nuclease family protein [Mycoplasmopsis fermentans]ADV34567.1 Conserved Hypothetical Protein [Mycoplasmopsis fermentans M64]BAH69752.1 hypothetical protein MBIO_0487 [Mycoplasmopsis fermentans PG18]VEU64122.1 T5orf172 domain [Mycoplasmopsis fermentans]VEU66761.1 T5orf172 domain [Mesomycoplasma conjunctivae]
MPEKGYVYVLTNPSFRDDWVKIGKSSRMPEVRGRELYNTAVPLPYEIYATLQTEKYNEVEKMIHKSIDRISKLRINKNREFFNIPPEKAYDILLDIKELLGNEAKLELMGDNVEVHTKEKTKRGEPFDFYSRGLKDGDVVSFIENSNIKAIVESNKTVYFENQSWSLSGLTREIYTRKGKVNSSGAYQGPKYFQFNGKRLTELPIIEECQS